MNIIKFVSVALWSMCMLFLSCKKENPSFSETPATVEILVCNSKGEPLENKIVGLYDESRYKDFQKDHTVKPITEVITNQKGIANFILESRPWFVEGMSAELMFVIQEMQDVSNYRWWSRGGTITLGKFHSFKIEILSQDAVGEDEKTEKPDEKTEENPEEESEEKLEDNSSENTESPFSIENGILTGIKDPSLTHIVLPAEVKSIASGAFWESEIESLVLNEGLESIGAQAFSRSRKLASVVFPASLKVIGEHAFEDCVALNGIDLSKTNLKEISSSAFRETGLKEISFPASLNKIAAQAFLGTHLEHITLPVGLREIGNEAFREVLPLKSITLPNDIQRIGYQAFYACKQLSEIVYVGKMTTAGCIVEIGAFQDCISLNSFSFPQSLSEIEGWTFIGCENLRKIVLPGSVKKIGEMGLNTNFQVETVEFQGDEAPELGKRVFPFVSDISKILVPSGKSEAYKLKWSSYGAYHSKIEEKP